MRRFILLPVALLAALALVAPIGAQSKPNFSGEWTMVPEKSDFGQMPKPTTMTRTITHTDPALKIVTTQTGGAMGDITLTTAFTTDGKPQKNDVSGSPMTTVGKWDGDAIVLDSTLSQQGNDISIRDRFVLSDSGKTLTLTRTLASAPGAGDGFTMTIVMTKKAGESVPHGSSAARAR